MAGVFDPVFGKRLPGRPAYKEQYRHLCAQSLGQAATFFWMLAVVVDTAVSGQTPARFAARLLVEARFDRGVSPDQEQRWQASALR